MADATLVDLVKITALTTGTGATTLGEAVPGYRGQEALLDGAVYGYSIQQEAEYELGRCTYLLASRQIVRTPEFSSNGGLPINLQANASIAFVATAEDILGRDVLRPLYGYGAPTNNIGLIGQTYTDKNEPVTLYGPKTATGWGVGVVLSGSAGKTGKTGTSDNTYTSYSEMQESDPTRASARLVGDTDTPPHADGPYNNPTQTTGGWVPQGADGIVTQAPGSPAILTQAQKNAQIVHIDDYGGRPNTASYDNADAYNRAADALGERGGTIRFDARTYFTTNLYARQFVTLLGAGRAPGVALANASHTILQAIPGTGALIDEYPSTPGFCFSVQCLSLKGDGAAGDCIGVKLGLQADGFTPLNVQYFLKDLDLDNFAHQAILIGGLNPIVDNVKATNSLLKRNRPGFEGVIHSFANDGNFTRIEPNSGLTQAEVRAALNGEFDLLKVVALVDRGANNFLSHIQPAYSGMGIYCSSPTSRFTNSRTDRNFGHGWAGTGMIDSETCFSYNNSLAGTNLYDGFNSFGMPSGTGTPFAVSDASVNDINGAVALHRYGINLSASGFSNLQQKVRVELPFFGSRGHATAAFLDHPSEPNIGRVSHGVSAVPNIEQATAWIADDFGAQAITDLPAGYDGQEIVIPGPAQIADGSIILLAGTTIAYDFGAVTLKYYNIAGTGKRWVQTSGIDYGVGDAAKMNSVSRPTPGKRFFRSDLNKFVYRNGANSGWVDGAGVAV